MQLSLFDPPPTQQAPQPAAQQAPQSTQQARPLAQQAPQPSVQALPPRESNIFDASLPAPERPKNLRERIERYLAAARAVAVWDRASRRASGVFVPAPQERDYSAQFALWREAHRYADMAWTCAQITINSAVGWKSRHAPPSLPAEANALAAHVLLDFFAHVPIKNADALAHLLHPLAPHPEGGRPREDLLDLRERAFQAWANAMHDQKLKAQGLDLLLERVALAIEGYDADERADYGELRHQHLRQVQTHRAQQRTPEANP